MWLFAKTGFYSVVHKDGDGLRLTIRARVKADLVALRREYLPNLGKIVDQRTTDYQFRAHATRRDFAAAAARIASDIDYDNFKDEVYKEQGHDRAAIYMGVWTALLALEPKDRKKFFDSAEQPAALI